MKSPADLTVSVAGHLIGKNVTIIVSAGDNATR